MALDDILKNLDIVKDKINCAKYEINYKEDIKIIGVTKKQSDDVIKYISENNLFQDLGENYVQEFLHKYEINPNLNWHLIGQLQSNKVKYIINKVCLIHSLDRESLANEINKQAFKLDKQMDCLIELNMGSEISKGGINPKDLIDFALLIDEKYKNIRLRGIMAIMPNLGLTQDLADLYKLFYEKFCLLHNKLNNRHQIDIRSCGMTNDYEYAIKYAKSTHLRIGRAIFGERI